VFSIFRAIICLYSFRFRWPCIINVGEERTNRWHRYRCSFTISLISTCFGHHYAHRQENRLYKTACGVSLDVLAAIVWSRDKSWAHCALSSWINICNCVICWFFLLLLFIQHLIQDLHNQQKKHVSLRCVSYMFRPQHIILFICWRPLDDERNEAETCRRYIVKWQFVVVDCTIVGLNAIQLMHLSPKRGFQNVTILFPPVDGLWSLRNRIVEWLSSS